MTTQNSSDIEKWIIAYRNLNRLNSELVQKLAQLVVHGASVGFTDVDSALLLEILQKHTQDLRELNERILG